MDSYDETLTNPSQKGKSKKESIDFSFKKPTPKEQKDNEMLYKNKKWGRVPKGYNPPTPDFLPQPPSSWFQSARSLCPGTTKELLFLCPEKLHCCPVPLETLLRIKS